MDTALTLASVPAVLAMVNLAKSFGLSGKFSVLVSVMVATTFSVSTWIWGDHPAFQAVATGIILGLSASGLYDTARLPLGISRRKSAEESEV